MFRQFEHIGSKTNRIILTKVHNIWLLLRIMYLNSLLNPVNAIAIMFNHDFFGWVTE